MDSQDSQTEILDIAKCPMCGNRYWILTNDEGVKCDKCGHVEPYEDS